MASIQIPLPNEFEDDIRAMLRRVAVEVIDDVRRNEQHAKEYMNLKQTCQYLDISFNTLDKWRNMGLKVTEIEGKKIISKTNLAAFLSDYEV